MGVDTVLKNLDWLIKNHIRASDETIFLTLVETKDRLEALQTAVDNWCKEEDVYYSVKCIPPDHVKSLFALRSKL